MILHTWSKRSGTPHIICALRTKITVPVATIVRIEDDLFAITPPMVAMAAAVLVVVAA